MTSSRSSSQSLGGLQRGKACISCRRRKVVRTSNLPYLRLAYLVYQRCDGVRPTCGQCTRGNRLDDCEYTDGQGRSRTSMLEEDILRLQARIQELEHPEHTTPAVALHHPYSSSDVPFGFQSSYISASISSASSSEARKSFHVNHHAFSSLSSSIESHHSIHMG
jgi:hypothetical protein